MARHIRQSASAPSNKRGCLLRQSDSVSGAGDPSFGAGVPAWEANTLPLSYTRENQSYFSPKNDSCKIRVFASSKTAPTELGPLAQGYRLCARSEDFLLEVITFRADI